MCSPRWIDIVMGTTSCEMGVLSMPLRTLLSLAEAFRLILMCFCNVIYCYDSLLSSSLTSLGSTRLTPDFQL
jgi:hypothetical protein